LQLLVRDAQSGEVLFSHQGEDNCVPASTVKLLTAGLACEILGPDFRFSTHLFADIESINNDTLCGDIHLIADGDPSLTSDDLTLLTASLARQLRGVEGGPLQLDGSLVMETAIFDTLNRGPGWMWDDGDYSWSADVTSLIVNLNCIGLECRESVHGKRLYWLPALELYPVEWRDGSALRRRVGNRFEIGHHVFREEPRTIVRNLQQPEASHGRAVLQLLVELKTTASAVRETPVLSTILLLWLICCRQCCAGAIIYTRKRCSSVVMLRSAVNLAAGRVLRVCCRAGWWIV
jgi:hypothetical protein